ncbi:NAD(P)/FAD-dependent oxidoreductase [Dethiothermospora halolimnae]|uniref:NAD(P)/FAD-dependent oxidoreductase n=1 Tax=Dethiothermospora halolimnae TaxID=3114390 RepID=UPI003CCC445F
MKLVSGDTVWTKVNRIPKKYTYLSENISCDVVIIGGGITGAICGYYFAKAGIDAVILEKNIIGYGSTSGSTSILQYEIDTDLVGLSTMIGQDNGVRAFKLCEKAVYDIGNIIEELDDNCDFTYGDCLYYSNKKFDKESLEREYKLRKEHGFDVEFIDKNKGEKMFSFPIEGGIYSRRGAGEIDPYRFTHSLISKSIERGLRVFENTEVSDINNLDDGVIVTTKNKFKINAKKAIIATGFEARNYITEEIVTLYRTFTLATRPVNNINGWHNKCIIRDTEDSYNYIRPTVDDRILIGGEDIEIKKRNSKIASLSHKDPLSIEKYNILEERLKGMFSDIKDISIEYKFSGIFGETYDGLPYIGEYKKMPNCYFCLGYGANGILYAILGGQLLRDMYLGNPSKDLDLFKFGRESTK